MTIDIIGVEPGLILDGAWVAGRPQPKGSLKPRGSAVSKTGRRYSKLTEDDEESSAWRKAVKNALARQAKAVYSFTWRNMFPLTVPVHVAAVFHFAPPADPAIASAPCGMEGDLDKLLRNLGDAMKDAGLIVDDRLITGWMAEKCWADDRGEGAFITVRIAP